MYELPKASWDNFHRAWILCAVVLIGGCAIFGDLSDEELIEAAAEAGCQIKSIKRDDGEIERIDCLDTVRVVHER